MSRKPIFIIGGLLAVVLIIAVVFGRPDLSTRTDRGETATGSATERTGGDKKDRSPATVAEMRTLGDELLGELNQLSNDIVEAEAIGNDNSLDGLEDDLAELEQ